MRRPPRSVLWSWIFAILLCQLGAIVGGCGAPHGAPTENGRAPVASTWPAHDPVELADICDATDCVVGQGLADVAAPHFAALPVKFSVIELSSDSFFDARTVPMRALSRLAGYPPPHVLGRLLI